MNSEAKQGTYVPREGDRVEVLRSDQYGGHYGPQVFDQGEVVGTDVDGRIRVWLDEPVDLGYGLEEEARVELEDVPDWIRKIGLKVAEEEGMFVVEQVGYGQDGRPTHAVREVNTWVPAVLSLQEANELRDALNRPRSISKQAAYRIGDQVLLETPFSQGTVALEAGQQGTVEAAYPSGLFDVSFDGIDVPEHGEGVIRTNTLTVPSQLLRSADDDHPDNAIDPGESSGPPDGDIYQEPTDEAATKKEARILQGLENEWIRGGAGSPQDFCRYASRRTNLTEHDIERWLGRRVEETI